MLLGLAACAFLFGATQLIGEASPLQQTAPSLGTASSFAVLGGSTVTNTGSSVVSADLGVSPGSAVTGFPPGIVVGGTIHTADALAAQAQSATTIAYNALLAQPCTLDLTGIDLGTQSLTPGVYCFSTSAQLTGTLTLNAVNGPNSVFVFRMGSTLTTASNSRVSMIPPGAGCNVFWQVGSSATLGTTTSFVGNILALTSITLNTNANMVGRALARNGAVTMDSNTVGSSTCVAGLPTTVPATATAAAAATATAVAAAGATPPPASGPFVPTKPAPTANLLAADRAAAGTATAVAAATATPAPPAPLAPATVTAVVPAAMPTATPAPVTQPAVVAATSTPTAAAAIAVSAPAPNTAPAAQAAPTATPVAPAAPPRPQLPSTLPNTGSGLPPLGLFSMLVGGLAVVGALTLRRTRK